MLDTPKEEELPKEDLNSRLGLPGILGRVMQFSFAGVLAFLVVGNSIESRQSRAEDRAANERNIRAVIDAMQEVHRADLEERRADRSRTLELAKEISSLAKTVERLEVRIDEKVKCEKQFDASRKSP